MSYPDFTEPALPAVILKRERFVRANLWLKLRKVAGMIPFTEDLVAAFYCATDPRTPMQVRGALLAALVYFISPVDVIPDFIAGFGFSDDAAVLTTVLGLVSSHIRDRHRKKARDVLLRPDPADID